MFKKPLRTAAFQKAFFRCWLAVAHRLARRWCSILRFRQSALLVRGAWDAHLVALAAAREVPIPVYAEMSSINPVFLLPGALAQRAEKIAQGLIDSVTLGTGQFCTKPGIVMGVAGPDFERFRAAAQSAVEAKAATTMLNSGIHRAYCQGTDHWVERSRSEYGFDGQRASGWWICWAAEAFCNDCAAFSEVS